MSDSHQPVLALRNVDTHYGPIQILRNVNIEIMPGEITCLLGGNASGKTTILPQGPRREPICWSAR